MRGCGRETAGSWTALYRAMFLYLQDERLTTSRLALTSHGPTTKSDTSPGTRCTPDAPISDIPRISTTPSSWDIPRRRVDSRDGREMRKHEAGNIAAAVRDAAIFLRLLRAAETKNRGA
jgi:hypothetical protein